MADPIWYLGPPGDLRALVCPERDFDTTEVRFGGVFQSLSGATTLTNTGVRQKVSMDFRYLTEEEYGWLEALNRRYVRGPFRLINPFKKNLLTGGAAMCLANSPLMFGVTNYQNMTPSNGVMARVFDWPSAAGLFGAESSKWSNRPVGPTHTLRWDDSYKTPVTAGKQYVGSVYIKGASATTGSLVVDWFNRSHVQVGGTSVTTTALTTSWQRFSATGVAPAGAVLARFAWYSNVTPDIYFAAAQLEEGSAATAWDPGGGAIVVNMDQLTVSNPRFPYRNTTLTLMEA
jgi:hypothetical protein